MKKSFFLCAACIAMVSYTVAQSKEADRSASGTITHLAEPPAPPPPPPPAVPPSPPAAPVDEIIKGNEPVPPVPSISPVPPVTPVVREFKKGKFSQPVVINSIGYEVSVHVVKGQEIVVIKNNGNTKKIKMATWLADRKYYEKKYGVLPPPPPPAFKHI